MSHEMYSTCSTQFQIRKEGVIQTSPVVAINKLKGPLTWLKLVIEVEQLFTVLEQWRTAIPKINWALSRSNHTKCYPSMWLIFVIEHGWRWPPPEKSPQPSPTGKIRNIHGKIFAGNVPWSMMDIIYIWWNMFIGNNVYLQFWCIL